MTVDRVQGLLAIVDARTPNWLDAEMDGALQYSASIGSHDVLPDTGSATDPDYVGHLPWDEVVRRLSPVGSVGISPDLSLAAWVEQGATTPAGHASFRSFLTKPQSNTEIRPDYTDDESEATRTFHEGVQGLVDESHNPQVFLATYHERYGCNGCNASEVAAPESEALLVSDESDVHHDDMRAEATSSSSRPVSLFDTLSINWEADEERIVTWSDVGRFALKWSGVKAIRSLVSRLRGTDSSDSGIDRLASQLPDKRKSHPPAKPRYKVYEPLFSMEDPGARRKRFAVAAIFTGITVLSALTVPAGLELTDAGFRILSLY